jgi:hypothetical protein
VPNPVVVISPAAPAAGPVPAPGALATSDSGTIDVSGILADVDIAGALAGDMTVADDLSAARGLFEELLAGHVTQVRDLMLAVHSGEAATRWIEPCKPALSNLRRMAEQLEMQDLCTSLDAFLEVVQEVLAAGRQNVDPQRRQALMDAYARLSALLPSAFELGAERDRREPIIVHSLLLQACDQQSLTVDKVYGAGLTRFEMFCNADP